MDLVKPHVYTKSGDWDMEKIPETPVVRKHGGEARTTPLVPGLSTTSIIKKIIEAYGKEKL
jgi:glycerol-3-phosphate cytidylyltransferase